MRRMHALLLAPFLLAGAPPPRAVPVEVLKVEARELVSAVSTTGTLETDLRQVCAEVGGVVRELAFEEGDEVEAGSLLASIDPETYTLRAGRAQAALARAEAQLEEAGRALERRRKLRTANEGWVSEEEILQHESRLKEAQAAAEEARMLRRLAEEDALRSRLRAPSTGVVERRHVVQGQFLQPGAPVASLVDPAALRLRFKVTALEATSLEKGQEVSLRLRERPGDALRAVLFHIAAQADPATRTVECVARVEAPPAGRLRAGSFAEVRILTARKALAVLVPEGALLPTERGYAAFVAEGRIARRRGLTLGLHTPSGEVEILSGLSPGDLLVVRGAQLLADGTPVSFGDPPGP